MSGISQENTFLKCAVCDEKHDFTTDPNGPLDWLVWQGVTVLACGVCIERHGLGRHFPTQGSELVSCMMCEYPSTIQDAVKNSWTVDAVECVIFCPWCAHSLEQGNAEPLPLSCTAKTQENSSFDLKGGRLLLWLERGTMVAAFLSIGTRLPVVILLSVCACIITVFVRWYARGANLPVPPTKKTVRGSKNSAIKAVKRWLEQHTPQQPPF